MSISLTVFSRKSAIFGCVLVDFYGRVIKLLIWQYFNTPLITSPRSPWLFSGTGQTRRRQKIGGWASANFGGGKTGRIALSPTTKVDQIRIKHAKFILFWGVKSLSWGGGHGPPGPSDVGPGAGYTQSSTSRDLSFDSCILENRQNFSAQRLSSERFVNAVFLFTVPKLEKDASDPRNIM